MILSEADTRAKLIDPALHQRGWTEDLICREETERGIDIVDGKPRRRRRGRTDYLLRIRINISSQPIAIALIEAKRSDEPPDKGLEQAKKYARLNNVPFVYSSNGHLFVEYDRFTGKTSDPLSLVQLPTPLDLRSRYEKGENISLESEKAKPLLVPYPGGEASRRYYQDAAIRAALEKIARGEKRVLLFLATGSGKTFIAVHLLKKIADAAQLRRALFVCDRDELRIQGLNAFQNVFGNDAAPVSSSNPQKNARILIATYQTLNVAGETEDAKFLVENYPENYFSHIIIDECHRSAWNKWSIALKRNPEAIQIGLTATPRFWEGGTEEERKDDHEITANNLTYFGDPVYEYDMSQGTEDGYLPACEVIKRATDLDERGVTRKDIERLGAKDAITGQLLMAAEARTHYEAPSFEAAIQLPDRVNAWCKDLFEMLLHTGGPHQKTVIFCVRDTHADAVAAEMNNLYAGFVQGLKSSRVSESSGPLNSSTLKLLNLSTFKPTDVYAFKCTASVGGSEYIADLRGSERSHYIATTVDLITTGVDVPILCNIVFFKSTDARELPYIGLEHIESETGEIINMVKASEGKTIQSTTFKFNPCHVLYGKLRPYLNKVAIPDFEGRCTTELLPLMPENGCDRYYLAWLLRRRETVEEAMRHKTGTRMPRADMDELFKMFIPFPPIEEQQHIASKLQELMQEIERAQATCEKQLEAAKTLPQAILRKAFRGEL